jgi:hypothetical protein
MSQWLTTYPFQVSSRIQYGSRSDPSAVLTDFQFDSISSGLFLAMIVHAFFVGLVVLWCGRRRFCIDEDLGFPSRYYLFLSTVYGCCCVCPFARCFWHVYFPGGYFSFTGAFGSCLFMHTPSHCRQIASESGGISYCFLYTRRVHWSLRSAHSGSIPIPYP